MRTASHGVRARAVRLSDCRHAGIAKLYEEFRSSAAERESSMLQNIAKYKKVRACARARARACAQARARASVRVQMHVRACVRTHRVPCSMTSVIACRRRPPS